MSEHHLAATTHTVELDQIAAINAALRARAALTAEDLDVRPTVLAPDAALQRLTAAGDPAFPEVFGLFSSASASGEVAVPLHTAQLRAVSSRLGLHHRWGLS